eukprot:m.5922 g.5922  ORF g.5922 m.5922 type:complete len:389 (+) comp14454_c0_seq1:142-1308(+)
MQIYKGLDIVTNKISASEQQQCRHHFIGSIPLFHEYTVAEFRKEALPLIDRLQDEGRLPIVVGGTNYYIESLLWNILIDSKNKQVGEDFEWLMALPDDQVYGKLKEIDPDRAAMLHPNDVRKIRRSLEVFAQCGRPHGKILAEQRSQPGGGEKGGGMRFPDATVFWLQCDCAVLDARLNARADEMVHAGLRSELCWLHQASSGQSDKKKGIFQAIGYKEFCPYYAALDEVCDKKACEETFQACVEKLKSTTRSYARKQITWIQNRFLKRAGQPLPDVFGLDASDLSEWDGTVLQQATDILSAKLNGTSPPVAPLDRLVCQPETWTLHICEVCDGREVRGDHEWRAHLASRGHQKKRRRQSKKAARQKAIDMQLNSELLQNDEINKEDI